MHPSYIAKIRGCYRQHIDVRQRNRLAEHDTVRRCFSGALLILVALGFSASANKALITTPPAPDELADILFPANSLKPPVSENTRNVQLRGVAGVRKSIKETKKANSQNIQDNVSGSARMAIQFRFGSSELQVHSYPMIDSIALMLLLKEMEDIAIYIEGHTDSVGGSKANKRLSLHRAQSVKEYIVRQHGIDPDRLHVSGKGESEPLLPDTPEAPANRRVVIKPL